MTLIVILLLVIIAILLFGAQPVLGALMLVATVLGWLLLLAVGALTAPAWLGSVAPVLAVVAVAIVTAIVMVVVQARGKTRMPMEMPEPAEEPAPVDVAAVLDGSGPVTPAERAALLAERRRLDRRVSALSRESWGERSPDMADAQAGIARINDRLGV